MPPGDRRSTCAIHRVLDRMTQELRIRGMAERTVEAYVHAMRLLTERTGLPPGHVTEEDLKAYLDGLLVERHVAPSTYAQHLAAMRFLYTHLTDGSMGRGHEAQILKADDDEAPFRYLDHRSGKVRALRPIGASFPRSARRASGSVLYFDVAVWLRVKV
jgi:hypothetical protein